MLQSLIQQAAAINAAFPEPAIKKVKDVCLALWELNKQSKAEELVSILADLKTTTTIIGKESSPSISMILPVLKKLYNKLQIPCSNEVSETPMLLQVKK